MSNILFHTATLYNYCGEDANGNAKYQTTVLDKVYMRQAAGVQVADRAPADQTILYFFDTRSSAASALGEARSWAEPEEWEEGHKTWTVHDDGRDILIPGSYIVSFVIFLVLFISIFVTSVFQVSWENLFLRVITKIALLPVVTGIAFELIRLTAFLPSLSGCISSTIVLSS